MFWSCLELNSAGQWPSSTKFGDPWPSGKHNDIWSNCPCSNPDSQSFADLVLLSSPPYFPVSLYCPVLNKAQKTKTLYTWLKCTALTIYCKTSCKARDTMHNFCLSQTKDWYCETIVAFYVIVCCVVQ